MRLLYCQRCFDVVRLTRGEDDRHCECGRAFGRLNEHGLVITGGPGMILGVTENQLRRSVELAPDVGEGPRFFAFVMPKNSPSVKRVSDELD